MSLDIYRYTLDRIQDWVNQNYDRDEFIISVTPLVKRERTIGSAMPKVDGDIVSSPVFIPKEVEEAEILLLSASEKNEECELLTRMGQAIDKHISKAYFLHLPRVIEEAWLGVLFSKLKKARWILISEIELHQIPELRIHFQSQAKRSLAGIPIFLLAELNTYLHEPELKKNLWKSLLSEL